MQKGGPTFNRKAAEVIRYAGLIVPIILIIYGFVLLTRIAETVTVADIAWLFSITLVWMAAAIWQFIWKSSSRLVSFVRLSLYHLLAAAYIIAVTGTGLPLIVFWVVLLAASFFYLQKTGVVLNTFVFAIVINVSIVRDLAISSSDLLYNVGLLLAILVTGLFIVWLAETQKVDQNELNQSTVANDLERSRMLTIINNLTDAIITTDPNNTIQLYNAASLSLLDTNVDLANKNIDIILPLADSEGNRVLPSSLFKKTNRVKTYDDLWYVFEDGEPIRLELTLSPIRSSFQDNQPGSANLGFTVILRDITKAKDLEEERDEFISVVSHELRTPITTVEGSLSNLQLMVEKGVPTNRIAAALELAHNQSVYLARMVNDLSTLSRAERGISDEPELINVRDMINSLYNTYLPDALAKNIAFDLDLSGRLYFVDVSRLYLEELLQNFITNAIRYTKQGTITISVARSGDKTIFAVKDTGIGISKTDQEKIFRKFYRSEDYRTRETGGTGLGLYVAAKLAKKLDTRIQLSSRLNHGSEFSFELPTVTSDKS